MNPDTLALLFTLGRSYYGVRKSHVVNFLTEKVGTFNPSPTM